jgi:hypothetical protein
VYYKINNLSLAGNTVGFVDSQGEKMKQIFLLACLIITSTTQAESCYKKTMKTMKRMSTTPNVGLAKYMCVWFTDPVWLKRAVIIGKIESDFRNITSPNGEDFGVFQVHDQTVKDYGLDKRYLMGNLFYQFDTFERVMKDKLKICKNKQVPEACWHSTTAKHYDRYSKLYTKYSLIYDKEK